MNFKRGLAALFIVVFSAGLTVGCVTKSDYVSKSNYVLEINNGERFFKSEVIPKSKSEEVILDSFKIEISDDYDKFKEVYVDGRGFEDSPEIYKDRFDEGLYTEEITIHSMVKLSEEEYLSEFPNSKYYPYMDNLKEYDPYAFEIIEVNYTNKFTDKLNEMAQWGNGEWTRFFVVTKEKKNYFWEIFDIYGHM